MAKRTSGPLSFRNVDGHQIDTTLSNGDGFSIRILPVRDRLYYLQIVSPRDVLASAADREAIFDGFNFTNTSRLGEDSGLGRAKWIGLAIGASAIALTVIFLLRSRRKGRDRQQPLSD